MNFTSFLNLTVKQLKEELGQEYELEIRKVMKNNGIMLTGIIARKNSQNSFPTVYVDGLYRDNLREEEISEIAQHLAGQILEAELKEPIDMSGFLDFSKAKERIVFRLINTEKNRELLKDIPNRQLFNLSVVYYYILEKTPFEGTATILIRNSHMKSWNIGEEQLYETAYQNSPRLLPLRFMEMREVLEGFYPEELIEGMSPMYVLSNAEKMFGAVCMIYPEALKEIAKQLGGDLFVLPSSVHEMILIPERPDISQTMLADIVKEVNHTQLLEEEILADSVFFYNIKEDALYLLDNH